MKDYWYPWHPVIFRKATRHLTLEQDCIYRRLIDEYMETGEPLPDNDVALARIAGISVACWTDAKLCVLEFFRAEDGFLFHDFCNEQLDEQDKKSRTRSKSSKKAALTRWGKKKKSIMRDACATQCESDAEAMRENATGQDKTGQEEEVVVISAREDEPPELPHQVTLSKRIGQITGWDTSPNWFGDYSRLEAWLHSGWDAELDILPTITRIVAQRKAKNQDIPKNLNYFEQAVANAHEARLAPTPKGTPNENTGTSHNGRAGKHAGHAPSGPSVDEQAERLKRRYGVPGSPAAGQPGDGGAGDRHPAPVLENAETLRIEGR